MHADALSVCGGEPGEGEIVQVDESAQQVAGWIDFGGKPPLGEIDLHLVGPLLQTATHFGFVLAQQVFDELLARITGNPLGRVHETQCRGEMTACLSGTCACRSARSRY